MLPYEGGELVELLRTPGNQLDLLLAAAIRSSTQEETKGFSNV